MQLNEKQVKQLQALAGKFRIDVIKSLYAAQTGHPGGSLSVCEILTLLYFVKANISPENWKMPDRDRVVLCKGHAAPMLYRILAEKKFLPLEEMQTLRCLNTRLQGHPSSKDLPGVELSTGPLGIGLSACLGMALSLRMSGIGSTVYAILGDGELNEGTIWEAAMAAAKFKADNLIAIVDYNGVQLDGCCDEIMPMGDIAAKFRAFGWEVYTCDGHDFVSLNEAIDLAGEKSGRPKVILARTVKGKGVSFMEGKNVWHGQAISGELFQQAMSELGGEG